MSKSYSVMNLSFRDEDRKDSFLLIRESADNDTVYIPSSINEKIGVMFPSQLTEFICQDTLAELESDIYTTKEVDLLISDLKKDIETYITANQVSVIESDNIMRKTIEFKVSR